MFLFSVLLFFLLACLGAWLLLFPAGREAAAQSLAGLGQRLDQRLQDDCRQGRAQAFMLSLGVWRQLQGLLRGLLIFLRRRYLLMLAAATVLAVPSVLALWLSGRDMLGGFDGGGREVNAQVAELLKGEQLAAPSPPPPLAFTTTEVVLVRPLLDSANRNWQLLDPGYAQRLLMVFRVMKERYGYDMAILEGYRSPDRQNLLAAAGPAVTNAKAFQSYHQFGLAADCAFLRDGKLLISEKDPWAMRGYRLYGETAESLGLRWGGRWSMMDFGHTELRVQGTVKK